MTAADLLKIITRYDEIVRGNMSDDLDTIAAVASCKDGIFGAWGEVLDTANDLGYADSTGLDAAMEVALHDLFVAYQEALRTERKVET